VREDSKLEMRRIPPLPQQNFVLLWKSLYSLFMEDALLPETEEQQRLYHSVSVVGTLLLQIGEVGQQFSGKNLASGSEKEELPPGLVSLQEVVQLGGGDEELASKKNGKREGLEEEEGWSITFEQFYASILTEPSLVDNFSQKTDIEASLKDYNSFGRPRQSSVETKDNSRSVFYV